MMLYIQAWHHARPEPLRPGNSLQAAVARLSGSRARTVCPPYGVAQP
jgi:hypothetical protein